MNGMPLRSDGDSEVRSSSPRLEASLEPRCQLLTRAARKLVLKLPESDRAVTFVPWNASFSSPMNYSLFGGCESSGCERRWSAGCCPLDASSYLLISHRDQQEGGGPSCSFAPFQWPPRVFCRAPSFSVFTLDASARLPTNAQALLYSHTPSECVGRPDSIAALLVSDWFDRQMVATLRYLDSVRVANPVQPGQVGSIWRFAKREAVLKLWYADAAAESNAVPLVARGRRKKLPRLPSVAVISYGQVRSTAEGWFELSFTAVKRYVIEPLEPYVHLFVDYNCPTDTCNNSVIHQGVGTKATSINVTSSSMWPLIYSLDASVCNWTEESSKSKDTKDTRLANRHFYLMGMRSLHRAMLAVEQQADSLGIGSIIITRIDTLFFSPGLSEELIANRPWKRKRDIFVPATGNYGFLSDQFAYGNTDVIKRFVDSRIELVMATCDAQMCPESIACHVTRVNKWNAQLSAVRIVRLRSNWDVPHRDIINCFPGVTHNCCGDTATAQWRALPPLSRNCTESAWEGPATPTDSQLDAAHAFFPTFAAQSSFSSSA
ncbi:MAG: hypothetical protein SGPRY_010309 [Prymnesium sp.]